MQSKTKSIRISESAWQALQEFKFIITCNNSYSKSLIEIRNQLLNANIKFSNYAVNFSPLLYKFRQEAVVPRYNRHNDSSKSVLLTIEAWNFLKQIKLYTNCKSFSESILYLYQELNSNNHRNFPHISIKKSILSECIIYQSEKDKKTY